MRVVFDLQQQVLTTQTKKTQRFERINVDDSNHFSLLQS